jgi:Domain of unknown function (DUF4164)
VAQHSLPPPLSQALARLRSNLSGLESAAERHLRQNSQESSLATELALMQDDRARLASELDSAMARADRMAKSAKEVDKRLVAMARTVKKVLGEDKTNAATPSDPNRPGADTLFQDAEGARSLEGTHPTELLSEHVLEASEDSSDPNAGYPSMPSDRPARER